MKKRKTNIKVFVTKNQKFRAKINEPGNAEYEVTIGGEQWKKGKGYQHITEIRMKISRMLHKLKGEYLEGCINI